MTPVFIIAFDYQDFTFFIVLKISGRFIMVKGTIIEEENCFLMIQPENLCRQFNK